MLSELVACLFATAFFGVLLRQPRRAIPVSALIGTLGYAVYLLAGARVTAAGYFAGALVISLLSELAARQMKMTASLFLISAVIPLVPGLGLYRTMLCLVQNDYAQAARVGMDTLLGICAIALAVSLATLLFSNLPRRARG